MLVITLDLTTYNIAIPIISHYKISTKVNNTFYNSHNLFHAIHTYSRPILIWNYTSLPTLKSIFPLM